MERVSSQIVEKYFSLILFGRYSVLIVFHSVA
jgi:hypothetical protein